MVRASTPEPPDPPPEPPTQADCCKGDCGDGCVFALHEREMDRWRLMRERYAQTATER